MNHQTAKIIAESYREQARIVYQGIDDTNPLRDSGSIGFRDRAAILHDHAAVWDRVAGLSTPSVMLYSNPEAPNVP